MSAIRRRMSSQAAPRAHAWTILQRVDHPDPAAANAQALDDLENGATGLILIFAESISANGYGLEPSPAVARARARRRRSRRRHRHRPQSQPVLAACRPRPCRFGEKPRHRARRGRYPFQHQSDRRLCRLRHEPATLERSCALFRGDDRRACRRRISRPVRCRRRPGHPQCRRLGRAGTGFRARQRRRLSARARSRRHDARCGARRDLFPAVGGCRPVPDHGEIPRRCENCGRASKRPAGLRRSRSWSPRKPRGG